MASKRALVVGGSGFLGSSVCRSLLKHGYQVTSLARNGAPSFNGIAEPEWVNWIQGSAFDTTLLKTSILPEIDCVVYTLGILFEEDYKSNGFKSVAKAIAGTALRRSSPAFSLLGYLLKDDSRNPLAVMNNQQQYSAYSDSGVNGFKNGTSQTTSGTIGAYERINRDSALNVLQAFLETRPVPTSTSSTSSPLSVESPFIYVSAEDIFRPFVPQRYILTKREAEMRILRMADTARSLMRQSEDNIGDNEGMDLEKPARLVRPVFVRPGLMFDYDTRPITRLPSTLLRLSSAVQASLPTPLRAQTASSIISSLAETYASRGPRQDVDVAASHSSLANLLSIPPLHVDVVAEAIARATEVNTLEGVLDVADMRSMVEGRPTGDSAHGSQVFA